MFCISRSFTLIGAVDPVPKRWLLAAHVLVSSSGRRGILYLGLSETLIGNFCVFIIKKRSSSTSLSITCCLCYVKSFRSWRNVGRFCVCLRSGLLYTLHGAFLFPVPGEIGNRAPKLEINRKPTERLSQCGGGHAWKKDMGAFPAHSTMALAAWNY